jgi:hypothetical protein
MNLTSGMEGVTMTEFDAREEAQKVLDVANRMADAGTKDERRESATAADNLRGELCELSHQQLRDTLGIVSTRSDDANIIKDFHGKITGLTFMVSDNWFIGMDLSCGKK